MKGFLIMLKPKLFSVLKEGYSREQFIKDLSAGFVVGIIAIPLSIALAVSSGVSPEKGLYTAIIAGLIISLLGGSRVQISGPTAAFVVITYDVIQNKGFTALIAATIMAGLIMIIFGLLKLGSVIKFIPYPITAGFASGIAVIVFIQQIKDFLGLDMDKMPSDLIPRLTEYAKAMHTGSINSLVMGVIALLIIIGWPYINKKIPGPLVAIVITSASVRFLGIDVETIGDRYNDLSADLPSFYFPEITLSMVAELLPTALIIAVLASIESLLSAVVADGMIGDKHRSNMELIAQGFSNIFSALFGGIPSTGAISRTAANIRYGSRTPVASIVHSLTILIITLLFMPFVKMIPMTTLAAILMVAVFNLGGWRNLRNLSKAPKTDSALYLATFALTIVFDLVIAIEFGIIIAAFLFMKRMADSARVESIRNDLEDSPDTALGNPDNIDPAIQIFQVHGPFFFGAADKFTDTLLENISPTRVIIIRMFHVPFMDETGYHALFKTYSFCRKHKILLIFTQVQPEPLDLLEKHGFVELVSRDNFCDNIEQALVRANAYIELQKRFPANKHAE
jgi:SulP family sulfate permease